MILASLIGTSIEFYDFYIYATAAVLVFPALFFPAGAPATALLSSFAVFVAAFIGRPLGSIPFLASALLVFVGLFVRFLLVEAPAFTLVIENGAVARVPLAAVFLTSWRQLILGTFIMVAT